MSVVVRLPEVLTGMEEATLAGWRVEVGQEVRPGEPLADVETEKASVEYVAEIAGVLAAHLVPPGLSIPVGTPIAVLTTDGETVEQAVAGVAPAAASPALPTAASQEEAATDDTPVTEATQAAEPVAESVVEALRRPISPLVRRLARERGIDLSGVRGTGPAGRIVRRDLDGLAAPTPPSAAPERPHAGPHEPREAATAATAAITAATAATAHPATPAALTGVPAGGEAVPHTGMRRAIARRLTESTTTVPHFSLGADCRVDALLALRRQVNDTLAARVSVTDFVVKAVAGALQEVPEMNAVWTADAVLRYPSVDVAVAVALDEGLVTPVVRNAAGRSLTDVSSDVRDLAVRARSGRLRQDELEGGTFAVSNLGMYGTQRATAIISPPHAGILAVGAVVERPVVEGGQVVVGSVMTVTLSADHRVVDGATGARWLTAFVARVENPLRILV